MTAVDSACPRSVPHLARARAWTLSPGWWLGGIVAVSAVARMLVGLLRSTPNYFPDEYLYGELGRSIAETGRPLVRGGAAHFPALLQPLLTAPAWLVHDQAVAYRLAQGIDVLAMSLAAVPAYLLARRLRVGAGLALAVAALAVALPDMLYASSILSEPVAYPLVLGVVAAAVAALDRPSLRRQLLLVLLIGLAAFARVQFAALPVCFVVAALAVGVRQRRLRAVAREQRLALGLFGVVLGAGLAVGLSRNFGYYPSFVHVDAGAGDAVHAAGANLLVLLYAAGWVLVPGALLGTALALARPRSDAEVGFAAFTLSLAAVLLAQASLYGDTHIVQERYLFYLVPLAGVAFALYASRAWPHRLAYFGLSAALAALAAVVPLAGYAAVTSLTQSLFLTGVFRLGQVAGDAGTASVLVAGAAGVASLLLALAARAPRLATPLALALAFAAFGAATVAEVSFDHRTTTTVRSRFLPADRSWIDHAGVGRASLLLAPGRLRTDTLDQLFWNRALDRVFLLPGAARPDVFRVAQTGVAEDGTVVSGSSTIHGPLVVDGYSSTVRLRDARPVAKAPTKTLWLPRGAARLELLAIGRYFDGWLGSDGTVMLWPERRSIAGWLTVRVTAPRASRHSRVLLRSPQAATLADVGLRGGESRLVRVRVCSHGPWQMFFTAGPLGDAGGRIVSVRSTVPMFRADARACAGAAAS